MCGRTLSSFDYPRWRIICPAFRSHALAKASCDVVLSATIVRGGEDAGSFTKLDQLTEVHESRKIRYACGLLHVVGDDGDRVVVLEFVDQLFDLGRGDRIERRAWLVEQNHLRPHRYGARDAQTLLLPAGQRKSVGTQLVLDLVPKRGPLERVPDAIFKLRFRQPLVQANSERDVLEDRHRKRGRFLEHHSDFRAQEVEVLRRREDVRVIERYVAGRALVWVKVVHSVQNAQQRRLSAAGRPDEGGDLAPVKRHADALQRTMIAVVEIQVLDRDLLHQIFALGQRMGDGRNGDGCYAHDVFLWAVRIRATMLRASTARVMISAPVHASFCQSL